MERVIKTDGVRSQSLHLLLVRPGIYKDVSTQTVCGEFRTLTAVHDLCVARNYSDISINGEKQLILLDLTEYVTVPQDLEGDILDSFVMHNLLEDISFDMAFNLVLPLPDNATWYDQ